MKQSVALVWTDNKDTTADTRGFIKTLDARFQDRTRATPQIHSERL